jgi:hypothetical protein
MLGISLRSFLSEICIRIHVPSISRSQAAEILTLVGLCGPMQPTQCQLKGSSAPYQPPQGTTLEFDSVFITFYLAWLDCRTTSANHLDYRYSARSRPPVARSRNRHPKTEPTLQKIKVTGGYCLAMDPNEQPSPSGRSFPPAKCAVACSRITTRTENNKTRYL